MHFWKRKGKAINGSNYTGSITTTTTYIGNFVYQTKMYGNPSLAPLQYTDQLLFSGHEQGRIRFVPALGNAPAALVFDYFVRDNQGNTRVVLTNESQTDTYPAATLETTSSNGGTAISLERQYYNITSADCISTTTLPWWTMATGSSYTNQNNNGNPANPDPYSIVTATSSQVYQLDGNTNSGTQSGDRFGLGITLKVMSGDKISILGKSVYHLNSGQTIPTGSYPVSAVLSTFLSAFANNSVVGPITHGTVTGATLNNSMTTTGPLTSTLNSVPAPADPTHTPKAGLNWILFDDQFRPRASGFDAVNATSDVVRTHSSLVNIPMVCDGYVYIFCSNESNIDVYFDNLQVVDTRGAMVEETHYYPQGLTMAGISDRAWNKQANFYHYQGKEMQNQEFSDGTGLEEYDFKARFYDPQLGRWNTQDPAAQYASPYKAMGNTWINGVDPDGKWGLDNIVAAAFGFAVGFVEYGISDHWVHIGKAFESGGIAAGEAELAYIGLGGGGPTGTAFAGTTAATISSTAIPFGESYAATSAFTYAQNYNQIESASSSQQVGLIAGYNATSAITAGFNSSNAQNWVDGWFKGAPFNGTIFQGALSQGIGGAISGAGNNILANGGGWTSSTGFSAFSGFVSSYAGQVAHNAVDKIPAIHSLENNSFSFLGYMKSATASSAQNIASGVTQQFVGNSINQIGSQNGYNVAPSYLGQYIDGETWWGSYVNGLGGYQSDIMGYN